MTLTTQIFNMTTVTKNKSVKRSRQKLLFRTSVLPSLVSMLRDQFHVNTTYNFHPQHSIHLVFEFDCIVYTYLLSVYP